MHIWGCADHSLLRAMLMNVVWAKVIFKFSFFFICIISPEGSTTLGYSQAWESRINCHKLLERYSCAVWVYITFSLILYTKYKRILFQRQEGRKKHSGKQQWKALMNAKQMCLTPFELSADVWGEVRETLSQANLFSIWFDLTDLPLQTHFTLTSFPLLVSRGRVRLRTLISQF